MEELNWFNCNGSESFVVMHKKYNKVLYARYDDVCVFWDFYFPVDTNSDRLAAVKGFTNMNDVAKSEYVVLERMGNVDFEEFFDIVADELYPNFLKHLTK